MAYVYYNTYINKEQWLFHKCDNSCVIYKRTDNIVEHLSHLSLNWAERTLRSVFTLHSYHLRHDSF